MIDVRVTHVTHRKMRRKERIMFLKKKIEEKERDREREREKERKKERKKEKKEEHET